MQADCPTEAADDDKFSSICHIIKPNEVRAPSGWRRVLGLPKSCLGRECREGRLRYSKRAGRRWILGKWILDWLEEGEVQAEPKVNATPEPKAVPATKRRRRERDRDGTDQPAAA
jgi:hypothetical protein